MDTHHINCDGVAEIYNLYVSSDYDVPFFLHEAADVSGPVPELAAGTGRLSLSLLDAGVRLTCVDGPLRVVGRFPTPDGSLVVSGDVPVLGEELGGDPAHRSGYQWIIDPLDGTTPYAAGSPLYGVLIALMRDAEPIVGFVHVPAIGGTLTAREGGGHVSDLQGITEQVSFARSLVTGASRRLVGEAIDADAQPKLIPGSDP